MGGNTRHVTAANIVAVAVASALVVATILLLVAGEPAQALFVGLGAIVTSAIGDSSAEAA